MIQLKPLHLSFLTIATLLLSSCTIKEPRIDEKSSTSEEPVEDAIVTAPAEPLNETTSVLQPDGVGVTLSSIKTFSILLPEEPTGQESYTAEMLADYLGKMFNHTFPVVQEPQAIEGPFISVGNTSEAASAGINADPREQAYKLEVAAGNLYILGGTRGPIYGAIALLEEDLGCRWYAIRPDTRLSPRTQPGPVIPTRSDDDITLVPRSYAPPFELRDVFYWDAFSASTNWAIFNRIQAFGRYNKMTPESGGGLSNANYWVHTYNTLVPAHRYFASNPEFFPLRNGKRHPSTVSNGQLCYTSTGVVDLIVQILDAEIEKNPGTRIYSVSSNDNVHDNCECAPCQEIIQQDGVPGAQLYLANEVAAQLSVTYPEIKITTLAYVNSQEPPKHIRPGPNTAIIYAPIRQRYNHPSMLLPIGDIEAIRKELAEWNKIASHIYLWDYTDIIGKTPVPFPNFDAQDRAWDFLMENGVTGVFMQGTFVAPGSLGELKSWVYAKKLWDPSLPLDGLIDEFITAYYGPAAEEMAAYVALQRQAWSNFYQNRQPGEGLSFSPAEIARMYELLDAATDKFEGQPAKIAVLERERLTLLCHSLSKHPTIETADDYADKLQQAEALVGKFEMVKFGEGTTTAGQLRAWQKMLARVTDGNQLPQYSENSVTVKEALCRAGARFIPEEGATLGKASRQPGGNAEWGVQWPFEDYLGLLQPGTVYVVRMRVKADFAQGAPQNPGELFRLGAYTYGGVGPGSQGPVLSGQFPEGDTGEYRWIELGKLQVNTQNTAGLLYCIPGRGLGAEDAVWYDYLEFVPEAEFKDTALAARLPLIQF
jgi:hypothetical protein